MHARVSGQTLNGFRWDVNMGLFDICGTLSVFLGGGRSLPAQLTSELLLCSFLQLPVHIPHLPGCVCVGQDKRGHNLELLLHVQYSECYKIAVQRFPPWVLSHCFTRDERGTHFSAFWVNVSLTWFYMNSNKVTVNIKVNCDQILSLSLQVTPSSADAGVRAQQQKRVSLSAVIIQVVKCRNTCCFLSYLTGDSSVQHTDTHVLYSVFLLFVFECFCDEHSDLNFPNFFHQVIINR